MNRAVLVLAFMLSAGVHAWILWPLLSGSHVSSPPDREPPIALREIPQPAKREVAVATPPVDAPKPPPEVPKQAAQQAVKQPAPAAPAPQPQASPTPTPPRPAPARPAAAPQQAPRTPVQPAMLAKSSPTPVAPPRKQAPVLKPATAATPSRPAAPRPAAASSPRAPAPPKATAPKPIIRTTPPTAARPASRPANDRPPQATPSPAGSTPRATATRMATAATNLPTGGSFLTQRREDRTLIPAARIAWGSEEEALSILSRGQMELVLVERSGEVRATARRVGAGWERSAPPESLEPYSNQVRIVDHVPGFSEASGLAQGDEQLAVLIPVALEYRIQQAMDAAGSRVGLERHQVAACYGRLAPDSSGMRFDIAHVERRHQP